MSNIPVHVGYILDGNRRWAKQQGLASIQGHAKGQEALREVLYASFESGIRYVSVYAFSTENWQREAGEVSYIMRGVVAALKKYLPEFIEKGIQVRLLGERAGLPKNVLKSLENAEAKTAHFTGSTFAICLNYGGQQELADAVKKIVHEGIDEADISPELVAEHLYAPDIPACDLIVRTSGEQRLSNFMLWRAAYSELMFVSKNWPDMNAADVDEILAEYERRSRRFGS